MLAVKSPRRKSWGQPRQPCGRCSGSDGHGRSRRHSQCSRRRWRCRRFPFAAASWRVAAKAVRRASQETRLQAHDLHAPAAIKQTAICAFLASTRGFRPPALGVVDIDGQQLRYVASGTIRTTSLALGDLPGRLKILFDGITELAARYQPDAAAVEIVFVNVNPQSTLLLGQARGACITALVASHLPVAEYTALQMKKAVVGHGRAAKSQVQEMVRRLLHLPALPGTDAADGLGLAITHAHVGPAMGRL